MLISTSNTRDTSLYTNLCTKIIRGNTRENDGNRRGKLFQLKLNDIDCHTNYHQLPRWI